MTQFDRGTWEIDCYLRMMVFCFKVWDCCCYTHQAIPTQILTKCIVLVVEKLVSGGKAPLSPRIQIGWDTYLVKMLYLHDQI